MRYKKTMTRKTFPWRR